MKQSKTTIKELTKRYRSVLLKCALINAMAAAIMLTGTPAAKADFLYPINYLADTEDNTETYELGSPSDIFVGAKTGKKLTLNLTYTNPASVFFRVNHVDPADPENEADVAEAAAMNASLTGTVIINNLATLDGTSGFAVYNGRLKLGTSAASAEIYQIETYDGGTLDLSDNDSFDILHVTGDVTSNGENGTLNVAVDFNASNGDMDKLSIETEGTMADGILKLSEVNVTSDGLATSGVWMAGDDVDNGEVADGMEGAPAVIARTERYKYTFVQAVDGEQNPIPGMVTVSREALDVSEDLSLADAIADSTSPSISLTRNMSVGGNLGDLAGASRNFTIFGNGFTIDGDSHTGVGVGSGQTLTVKGVTMSNFTTAAITNAGTVNIENSVFNSAIVNTGTVRLAGTVTLNAALNGTVNSTGTLILGENADLSSATLTGGTIKLTLPATAVTTAMVDVGTPSGISLDVDMSRVSREEAVQYVLLATPSTEYTLLNVNNNRYAFSNATFTLDDYKADPTAFAFDEDWLHTNGELYILRLATAAEGAVEDLKSLGVPVSGNEQNAIAALNDEVIDMLAPAQQAAAQKINDLLEAAATAGNTTQMKQILREVAPEAAPSASSTASANAGAVMNVVGARMGGGAPAPAAGSGRSGGDYTAGALSAWAQMMYNNADLHKADGFDADSTGFAAGLEYAINEDVKAGIGYAFTDTEIDTARSKTDVDTHTVFAYGEYKPDAFYVNGVLSYGHSKYDEKTKLAGLESEYRANTFAGQVMTGYAVNDIVTPEAGLRYTSVRQRSYTNALGARLESETLDTWTWVAGAKAAKAFRVNDAIVTPDAHLALTYDFKRDGQSRTVTLANGSSYVAEGESMKRFGVEFGAGVSVKVGGNVDFGLSYEGKFKDHYTDHTALINVKYNF